MPVLAGPATTRAIRDICQRERLWFPPIVALCGATAPDEIRECREAGCVAHIAKPLSRKAFDELRALALGGRASRVEHGERRRRLSMEAKSAQLARLLLEPADSGKGGWRRRGTAESGLSGRSGEAAAADGGGTAGSKRSTDMGDAGGAAS